MRNQNMSTITIEITVVRIGGELFKPKNHIKATGREAWKRLKDLHDRQQRRRRPPPNHEDNPSQYTSINSEDIGTLLLPISKRRIPPTGADSEDPEDSEEETHCDAVFHLRQSQFQRDLRIHPFTDTNVARGGGGGKQRDVQEVAEDTAAIMPTDTESQETKPLNNNNTNGNGSGNGSGNGGSGGSGSGSGNGSTQSKPKIQPKYSIHRDVLTHEVVIKETGYAARDKSIPSSLRSCWQSWSFFALFTGVIPILQWLPKYSPRRDLAGDVIAGFTVAIMNIPHGMAYGILAGVSAGNGLYMAVFPVLVYLLLGTSKHISIGTFAVASMMTLKVVQTYATVDSTHPVAANLTATADTLLLANGTAASLTPPADVITNLEVVTSLALAVGIVNLLMAFLRLGTLASLLSDPLVNGFTTAAACHVVTAQLKDVLGIEVGSVQGAPSRSCTRWIDVIKSRAAKRNLVKLWASCVARGSSIMAGLQRKS
ncbi:GL22735 [Drosophila persimilis]|uniref:GL22735 n=1 Tax=Drosophila persimilis TaxID=7234 RepID=B4GZS7_DROPE|nr:GL22735 [Drosophila persimilis]